MRNRKRSGNTLVEFALAVTILVPVFTGCFQYGYTFFVYNGLINAVRDGARYASLRKLSNNGDGVVPDAYSTAVKNVVVYGNSDGTGSPIVPNLTTSNVNVNVTFQSSTLVPSDVTVSITNYTINGIFGSFTSTNKPTTTMPFVGSYCPTGLTC